MIQETIGNLPVASKNDKLLAKFHSGTSRVTDSMKLLSLFINYCSKTYGNSSKVLVWILGDFAVKVKNQQPIRLNLYVKFCWPVLPHSQILCLHHFNLRSSYFQSLQSLTNLIQLHASET